MASIFFLFSERREKIFCYKNEIVTVILFSCCNNDGSRSLPIITLLGAVIYIVCYLNFLVC